MIVNDAGLDTAELAPHLRRLGVGLALIFGSRATGQNRPDSDLDVGVIRADGRPLDLEALGEVGQLLAERSTCPLDLVDLATADALLRFEAVRDGRVVFESGNTRAELTERTLLDHDDIAWFLDELVAGVARLGRAR